VKRWIVLFVLGLITFVLLDLFLVIGHGEAEFPWSHVAGFFALFGFIGCLAIIGVAKLLGRYWLHREEDHYEGHDGE
jgi:hypothetical protein